MRLVFALGFTATVACRQVAPVPPPQASPPLRSADPAAADALVAPVEATAIPDGSTGAPQPDVHGDASALDEGFQQYFMPLAQNCIDEAHETQPGLRGDLQIRLTVVYDPSEDDTVVETVHAVRLQNATSPAPGLVKCIREIGTPRLKRAEERVVDELAFVLPI